MVEGTYSGDGDGREGTGRAGAGFADVVDLARLQEFLGSIVALDGPIDVALLKGGASNLTFVVRSGQHDYVVRRRPLGHVAAGAHDMSREYRVQDALRSTALPVADVYAYCEDEAILGAPFYVMQRVDGVVLHEPADAAGLSTEQRAEISRATVDSLCLLHATDLDAVGLATLGRAEGFVARRISRWLDQWTHSEHRDVPMVESLAGPLAASVPQQVSSTLVHGDYRLGNLVVDLSGPGRVAAILDWELSTLGDPLTDLAHLVVYWEPSCSRVTHEAQRIAEQAGFWTAGELVAHYTLASGRDASGLDFYLAFEHWRAAIIKEAIYMRSLDEQHPGEENVAFGEAVQRHLDEAAELMEEVGS